MDIVMGVEVRVLLLGGQRDGRGGGVYGEGK